MMKLLSRTLLGHFGRRGFVCVSSESAKSLLLLLLGICLISDAAGASAAAKKLNSTSVFPSSPEIVGIANKNVVTSPGNDSAADTSKASSFVVGTSRQARDYSPGGGGSGSGYSTPVASGSYGAPAGGGGGGYGGVAAGGGYANPSYAIPPIVLVGYFSYAFFTRIFKTKIRQFMLNNSAIARWMGHDIRWRLGWWW